MEDKSRMSKQKLIAEVLSTLATIFAALVDASVFLDKCDLDLGSIHVVIGNCATATMLNNKCLFVGPLGEVINVGIVKVAGEDYHPKHKGKAELSWNDDNDEIHTIAIDGALFFLLSPVNVVSVGNLSLGYGNGHSNGDQGTWIKSTFGSSWFLVNQKIIIEQSCILLVAY